MFQIDHLQTEFLNSPIGMDEPNPRFSYRLIGDLNNQSARQIVVCDENGQMVWDSGIIQDSVSHLIPYTGRKLRPFKRYEWTVCAWNERGIACLPAKGSFETGFMKQPWHGAWISDAPHSENRRPVNLFRKSFLITSTPCKARLYVTALGVYEAEINGEPVAESCFTPGWTQYQKRVMYQAYDVTHLLNVNQENRICVRLAEGWYCGRIGRRYNGRPVYGQQPMLKLELHITTADGRVQYITTDDTWNITFSELRLSDIYDGEHCQAYLRDIKRELTEPLENNAVVYKKRISIVWQNAPSVRRQETLLPKNIQHLPTGAFIVDFGQNIAGRERIVLRHAHRGTVITIRHGEMLYDDGSLYTENLRSSLARTIYEANDDDVQIYEPHFTYYGFRYLEVTGWPGQLSPKDISAVALYSDMERTGYFSCSNPLLNRLYENIIWGQKSNRLDIPTDCPQRDERVAWTGDTQVFSNVGTYNFHEAAFFQKWIADLNLSRDASGAYPIVAPSQCPWDQPGTVAGWSDAGIICPWQSLRKYGDLKLIENYLQEMVLYLDGILNDAEDGLPDNARFGDWLNINVPTSSRLISSCYLVGMNQLLANMARLSGHETLARQREKIAVNVSARCRKAFLTADGELAEKTQTAALLLLHFNVIKEKTARASIISFLIKDIFEEHSGHLSTGFLGTPLLLPVLTASGHADLAYELLLQTTYPSWLYPVTQGATTMWERWNSWTKDNGFGNRDMNSFNHYAYGAVGEWFYETICGIQPLTEHPQDLAFKRFRLAPIPNEKLGKAEARFMSSYGEIRSAWHFEGKKLTWSFTVPCNSKAELILPGRPSGPLPAGIRRQGKHLWAEHGEYTLKFI